MKRLFFRVLAVVALGLFVRAAYLVFCGPAEPAFDAANHDAVVARLNHLFTMAAYSLTWAIQLGYVAWLGLKWQAQRSQRPADNRMR